MVLTLAQVAVLGFRMGNALIAAAAAIAAAAYAANWPLQISPAVRKIAFGIQVLTLIALAGGLITVLSIADAGTTGWEEVPWWFWLAVAIFGFMAYKATAAGYARSPEED